MLQDVELWRDAIVKRMTANATLLVVCVAFAALD
jgi:hypothetical protein